MKLTFGNFSTELLIGRKEERRENPNLESEEEILEKFIKNFDCDLKIVSNSDAYTTVQYHDCDLFRLKYGTLAKWIEVCMPTKIKKKYINDPLFAGTENKNKIFWKSKINTIDDLNNFIEIIKESIILRDEID